MDYQLSDGATGDMVAVQVRKLFKATSIIFYSARSPADLRKLIASKSIDGVYCVQRDRLRDIGYEHIENSIKKIVDLTQMRGVVVAAVAELDAMIDDCLHKLHGAVSEAERDTLLSAAIELLESAADEQVNAVKSMGRDFAKVISSRHFNSAAKAKFLTTTLKAHALAENFGDDLDRLGKYVEQVTDSTTRRWSEARLDCSWWGADQSSI